MAIKMYMVAPAKQWEVSFIYSCFQIPQDLEGMTFSTVKNFNLLLLVYPVLDCWTILFLSVHLQDTKGVISATEVLKKEPVSDAIALKDSMKYFDADFFNDSKVNLNQ